MALKHLFVSGCPRSGTTALTRLLNSDERIVIGIERFKYVREPLTLDHFREEVFFSPTPEETNFVDAEKEYARLRERWDRGTVAVLGDKHPRHYKRFGDLSREFPGCRFAYIFRELPPVASSYNAKAHNPRDHWPEQNDYRRAIKDWNGALRDVREFMEADPDDRLAIVPHARLFAGDEVPLEALWSHLGLEPSDAVRRTLREMAAEWEERSKGELLLDDEMRTAIDQGVDRELEQWCKDQIREQIGNGERTPSRPRSED